MSRQILNPISASVYTGFQKRSDFFQKRGDFIAFSTRLEIQGKLLACSAMGVMPFDEPGQRTGTGAEYRAC
jgi:hypothetical protein